MKVYLAYPWKFPDSPYYKYLVEYPPKGIDYMNANSKNYGATHSMTKLWIMNFIKRNLNRIRKNIFPVPNLVNVKGSYNLVHCARCLNLSKIPYVVDLEDYWSLGGLNSRFSWGKRKIELELSKEKCKRILPWTNAAKDRFLKEFKNKKIAEKTETLHPAVPLSKIKKTNKTGKNINILFVSRYFWIKGGLFALEVLKKLREKYDIGSFIVSDVPKELKEKYSMLNFVGLVPYEELQKIYQKSSIFLYPSFVDTFGFSQLEAMSYGIPVITVDGFARKEIIDDGKTGFIVGRPKKVDYNKIGKVERKIINDLVEKTSLLIESDSLREKMSKNARKEIENGKFSLEQRNKRLKEIYLKCI